jgi:hypothetical protein
VNCSWIGFALLQPKERLLAIAKSPEVRMTVVPLYGRKYVMFSGFKAAS